jgi:putative aminopeptidase FrvX
LQLGTTSGGTDSSAFSAGGAIDVGLSWPGRYSHSPVEIMDKRDLEALVRLIVALARNY